jgi:hypothetical protein
MGLKLKNFTASPVGSDAAGPFDDSTLQPELVGIAEVAGGEPVEEGETGNAVKSRRSGWYADSADDLVKSKSRQPDANIINWKRTDVSAPEIHGWMRNAAAEQAIVFVEYKLEIHMAGACTRIS